MSNLTTLMDEIVIVRVLHGSKLYGLATSSSDTDYKGVYLPSLYSCFKGSIVHFKQFNTNTKSNVKNTVLDTDYEIWSLQKYLELVCSMEVNAIDLLLAPSSAILQTSEIWEQILEYKQKIFNKNIKYFLSCVDAQIWRYGLPRLTKMTLTSILSILYKTVENNKSVRLKEIFKDLPFELEQIHIDADSAGLPTLKICGKSFQENVKVVHVITQLENIINNAKEREEQTKNNVIDWKRLMHAFRICYVLQELSKNINFVYPLPQNDFLMKLRLGSFNYINDNLYDRLEDLKFSAIKQISGSKLRDNADTVFLDDFLIELYVNNL